MDNTERSDSAYVNTEVVETSSSLHPQRKITHQVMRVMGVHQNDLK